MASASKPKKEETPEEIMARKRIIVGGQEAGNLSRLQVGQEVMMNADGSNGFRIDNSGDPSSIYKWNEKTGDYRSHGGGIARLAEIPQEKSSGGKGGGGSKKPAQPSKGSVVYPDGSGEILDTNPTGGYTSWQEQMANYYPTTPNQALNPLVDPANWMYTPNPQHGILNNPGIYVNNPQPIGVLV